ncbi:MAG: biopolymer transporter ExbD [Rubrivivax sp.]|jgi:biopolymer transport protein ExbD|nr:biopolymer transporter ExbD [Rubrivivax sp.]
MSEIVITPLVDVMLVLLVIFIVAAPLMASRLPLELPRAPGAAPAGPAAALALAIDAQGQWYLADEPLPRVRIEAALREAAARDPSTEVHLRADRRVPYGAVAELIGTVQSAGLSRLGFVAESADAAR